MQGVTTDFVHAGEGRSCCSQPAAQAQAGEAHEQWQAESMLTKGSPADHVQGEQAKGAPDVDALPTLCRALHHRHKLVR